MPNWIEGTLKLRGNTRNIYKFFSEGLDTSEWPVEAWNKDQVVNKSTANFFWFEFNHEPHIAGTQRAFITDDQVFVDASEVTDIICINIKQAWSFISREKLDEWKTISDKYNLDLKLFGVESGAEVIEEVIIIKGQSPITNTIHFENWKWDCPFPCMGG